MYHKTERPGVSDMDDLSLCMSMSMIRDFETITVFY